MAATVQLDLEGMTCAACAARIEKKLNRVDGAEATVNFATERATVRCPDDVPMETLIAAVRSAGYDAHEHDAGAHHHHDDPVARPLAVAAALTLPVALIAMLSPLQFDGWEWVALALSTPIVFYAGAGFHRAALKSARHGTASMDTLIS